MHPIRALLVYLAAVFGGAATLAPWVHRAVQHLAPDSSIAHQPFHRYVSRCLLFLALLGLFPLVRALGIRSAAALGWILPTREPRRLVIGLVLGFASLALAAAVPVIAGIREWHPQGTASVVARHIINGAVSAVVVSILEELLFRGAVFGALRRAHGAAIAVVGSAVLYSVVHFFDRPGTPPFVDAWTGWTTLGAMLHGFTQWDRVFPGFLTLAVAGGILAWIRERTGSLTVGIGLHAGWIFWLKSFGALTRGLPGPSGAAFWGSAKLYDGWPACGILIGVALIVFGATRSTPPNPGPETKPDHAA